MGFLLLLPQLALPDPLSASAYPPPAARDLTAGLLAELGPLTTPLLVGLFEDADLWRGGPAGRLSS